MATIHLNIDPGSYSNTGIILNFINGQANWRLEVQEQTDGHPDQKEIPGRQSSSNWKPEHLNENRAIQETQSSISEEENSLWDNWNIWTLFESFYTEWNFHEADDRLWFLAKQIIANDEKEFHPDERNDMAKFYELLKGVIRAGSDLWALYKARKKRELSNPQELLP